MQRDIRNQIEATGRLLESFGAHVDYACPDLQRGASHLPRTACQLHFASVTVCGRRRSARIERHHSGTLAAGEALTVADLDKAWKRGAC